jgi:hypothetical protein
LAIAVDQGDKLEKNKSAEIDCAVHPGGFQVETTAAAVAAIAAVVAP